MSPNCRSRNHAFTASACRGVLVYHLDNAEAVCVEFIDKIQLDVIFDKSLEETKVSFDNIARTGQKKREKMAIKKINQFENIKISNRRNKQKTRTKKKSREAAVCTDMELGRLPSSVKSGAGDNFGQLKKRKLSPELEHVEDVDTEEIQVQNGSDNCYRRAKSTRKVEEKPYTSVTKSRTGKKTRNGEMKRTNKRAETKKDNSGVKEEPEEDLDKVSDDIENIQDRIKSEDDNQTSFDETLEMKAQINNESINKNYRLKKRSQKVKKAAQRSPDTNINCKYCLQNFDSKVAYFNHRRTKGSSFVCGICKKEEPFEAHLMVHLQTHRPEGGKVMEEGEEERTKNLVKKRPRMKCDVCGLIVSSLDSLKIHTMLHTGECPYHCCVCPDQKFFSLSSLRHHLLVHESAQRFQCKPCNQRFESRALLAKHQLTHEIKCVLCGEVFPNKTSRTCHYRVAHQEEILRCKLCNSMFATQEEMERHMVYHSKGKREQCPHCGLVVTKLKDHMILHNRVAGEKMFACDQCPSRYLRKSTLEKHMLTHTGERPYACNKCPKAFRSNGMLRKHLLTHTLEKPFVCDICGKRCAIRSNLDMHMRIHSDVKCYPCSLCSQAFNYKNSLEAHMKARHGNSEAKVISQRDVGLIKIPPVQTVASTTNQPSYKMKVESKQDRLTATPTTENSATTYMKLKLSSLPFMEEHVYQQVFQIGQDGIAGQLTSDKTDLAATELASSIVSLSTASTSSVPSLTVVSASNLLPMSTSSISLLGQTYYMTNSLANQNHAESTFHDTSVRKSEIFSSSDTLTSQSQTQPSFNMTDSFTSKSQIFQTSNTLTSVDPSGESFHLSHISSSQSQPESTFLMPNVSNSQNGTERIFRPSDSVSSQSQTDENYHMANSLGNQNQSEQTFHISSTLSNQSQSELFLLSQPPPLLAISSSQLQSMAHISVASSSLSKLQPLTSVPSHGATELQSGHLTPADDTMSPVQSLAAHFRLTSMSTGPGATSLSQLVSNVPTLRPLPQEAQSDLLTPVQQGSAGFSQSNKLSGQSSDMPLPSVESLSANKNVISKQGEDMLTYDSSRQNMNKVDQHSEAETTQSLSHFSTYHSM